MKKILKGFALALVVLAAVASGSYAVEALNKYPPANVGVHETLDFYGVKTTRLVLTASDASLVTGAGFLDAICPFGGTLGKYSMAFDTDHTAFNSGVTSAVNYEISPRVYTTNDTTSAAHGMQGCWIPPAPIKFVNGLYGQQDDAGHTTLFYVHCSDASNPCSL